LIAADIQCGRFLRGGRGSKIESRRPRMPAYQPTNEQRSSPWNSGDGPLGKVPLARGRAD